MENNKYYTPTIEEFHVGFECEIKNSSHPVNFEWEHFKIVSVYDAKISGSIMDWSFYDSYNAIKDGEIRVKYLDQEDIESCGWSFIPSEYRAKEYIGHNDTIEEMEVFSKNGFALRIYNKKYTKLNILNINLNISITIKNKSELIRLMKQLNINE